MLLNKEYRNLVKIFICLKNALNVRHWKKIRMYDLKLTSCRRAAATICPHPSPPSVGAEAPRAAEPTAPADRYVAVGSHGQYVPTVTAAAA